jgi:hypothetical protein
MMRNATPVEHVVFEEGDLIWKMYAQTDFVSCTFKGTAKNCNFGGAHFINCTFDPDFTFEWCNLGGELLGLPERLMPPAPIAPPLNRGGRPGIPGRLP